jgi:cytochrome c oxidase subunit 2
MLQGIPIYPEQASSIARDVDYLHYTLTAITLFFTALIFLTIFYFMVKYRRHPGNERPGKIGKAGSSVLLLEVAWTLIPSLICLVLFLWGSSLYFVNARTPPGAMEIFVTGRQWMWKVQHPEGMREINELHVPLGRPVQLTMTSEDVIHDFFVPAFRIKKDVLPGRYTSLWFTANQTGKFHLFCAQYCGAFHAGMGGWIVVMTPEDYERWLNGEVAGQTMEAAGESIFQERGCAACHLPDGTGRGPSLVGLFGRSVRLSTRASVTVNESYLRAAILNPDAGNVPGYPPIMPSYQGQIGEEQLLDLVAYIRSLNTLGNDLGKATP